MGKWKADIELVVLDKNGTLMTRKLSLYVDFDDLVVLPANQQDEMKHFVGKAIVQFTNNGIILPDGQLTYMGTSAVFIGQYVEDSDLILTTYLNGGYDDPYQPAAVLPDEFICDFPMFRRVKYRISSPAGNGVGYYKTPEDIFNGDPVEYSETFAFPLLGQFATLNGGAIGTSRVYTDWRYSWSLETPLQSDHVQARGNRV